MEPKKPIGIKFDFVHATAALGAAFLGINYFVSIALAAAPWPTDSQWNIITGNGSPLIDREARGNCTDPTNGGASPSQENDIGSQAKCSSAPRYNPGFVDQEFGNGLQPSATAFNTFSAANYYKDASNNSNACTNLADDTFFFRTRLSADPLQANANNGFKNSFWWATLDVNADGIIDFYIRVNGNGNKASETVTVIHEESTGVGDPIDNDPTGEPIIVTYTGPIDLGIARGVETPDNATVGDATEHFIDWQIPVTDFKNSTGTQILCYGNNLVLTNYSTSDANQPLSPFQKDFIQASGTVSDVITFENPDYTFTKTAADVNGGVLYPGDEVEYTITATNIGSNLADFKIIDSIPVGAVYVPASMKATLGSTTYNLTDATGVEPTCPSSTHCLADFSISNAGAVSFFNDWLYAGGSTSPLYDTITFKFRVTFAAEGSYSNQATGKVRELPDKLSDDPAVGGTADPTDITVDPPPPPGSTDLEITKTDGVTDILSGSSVAYTIVVMNNGPNAVVASTMTDNFAATLSNINWTCAASLGSSCSASGTGNISDVLVDLLVGGTATYSVTADTDPTATGTLVNTATIDPPIGITDLDTSNNSATDTDNYTPTDFGDAPDPGYPTLAANNGARHTIVAGKYLGTSVDADPDGLQNATATGDDIDNTDDEDGVTFTTTLIQGNTADLDVTAGAIGKLDAWIDFDANGSWGDPGEQIFSLESLAVGVNGLSVPIPPGATAGTTYARFRFSTAGGLSYTGAAIDGEVEDYQLTILTPPDLSTSTLADDDVDNFVSSLQTITYTLTITNTGESTGTDISVDDVLDPNFENLVITGFSNCGIPTNTSIANPPELHLSDISIAPANSCTVTFTVRVKAGTPGGTTIDNTATISPSAQGGAGATPASDTLTVPTVPDFSTSTKTDDDADNNVGNAQTITYTITVNNTGNGTGTGVSVDDVLDPNLENLVVDSITNCGTPTDASTATELHLSSVSVSTATPCVIVFFADVLAGAPGLSVIPNTVTISAAAEGGSGATKSSDNLVVGGTIDFSASDKVDNIAGSTVFPGDTITYTVSIDNAGNADATGVSLTDTIDENLGTPSNFSYTDCGSPIDDFTSPPTLNFTNIDVSAFTTCIISYDAAVNNPTTNDDPESIVINNSATINPANGSGTLSSGPLSLDVTPDLSTSTKSDDDVDNNIIPEQTMTYTILLNNTGDGTGTGITIDDVMDTNFGNLQITSISDCGAAFNTGGTTSEPPTLNITGLKVDPGVACSITYTVDIDTGLAEGTTLTNSADVSVSAQGGLGATADSDTLTIASVPFLTVAKTTNDGDNVVTPGQTVTYTITIGNDGNGTATGISATDTIDPNFSVPTDFNYSNCGGLASESFADPIITFSDLSAAVPLDCVISYTVMVNPGAADGASINNSADVGAASEGGNDPGAVSATTLTVSAPVAPPPGDEEPSGGGRPPSYVFERSTTPQIPENPQILQACLTYDPNRNLTFTDLIEESSRTFQKSAEILRDTYITSSNDYIISGYQSFTKDIGIRNIGLGNNVTKLEWAKVLMISHCLPIRNALSFKGKTILGNDLPHFVDLPLEHTNDETHDWYVDTIYTAAYYEIIGSPTAQWANANSFITVSEGIKMAIKTFEVLNDRPARTADSNVRPLINDEKWYFTYYSKAIAENIFSYLAQSPDRAETLLKRNEALYYLLDSMLRDNLYTMEDGSDIRDYFQKTFIGGKREPVTIGGEVLGVSTQDHLLLAKIGEYQLALEQERQRATIYVWASILLAGAAFFAGKGLKKKKEHRK